MPPGIVIYVLSVLYVLFSSSPASAQYPTLTSIGSLKHLRFDIRYASSNNFCGKNIYGNDKTTYLHPLAAERLQKASIFLGLMKPGWKIVIFDALRPLSAQQELWNAVRGTPQWKYVATPGGTSLHNYGLAVDITLEDEYGRRLDMGSQYDHFSAISEPRYEKIMLRTGKLSAIQVANRLFLRNLMKRAGWRSVLNEWWHFEVFRRERVKGKFALIR